MLGFSWAGILASTIFAALLFAACAPPVQADEINLVIGHGVVCDTAEEVKAVIAPAGDDVQQRLLNVNDRYGKEACNIVTVIFYKGDEAATILTSEGIVHVFKVQVIGVKSGPLWLHMKTPMDQYTAILEAASSV
jgi:hypothetical protein